MRKTLILPLVFMLVFLCVVVISVGIVALNTWALNYAPRTSSLDMSAASDGLAPFFRYIPAALPKVLPVAVIASLFLCFPGVRRNLSSRIFTLFLLGTSALLILIFGTMLTQESIPTFDETASPSVFAPEHIHRLNDAVVYADVVDGDILRGVLVFRSAGEDEGFSFYPEAMVEDDILVITGTENIPIEPSNPLFGSIFEPPEIIEPFLDEISFTVEDLTALYVESWNGFLFASLGLILLSTGCIFLAAFTRWPLINIVLCLVAFRGVFFLYSFLGSDLVYGLIGQSEFTVSIPTIGTSALGALMLILYLLFKTNNGEEAAAVG